MIHIRPERPEDQATIHQLAVAAYGREDEAEVVDQLRQARAVALALTAEEDGRVVGHIVFSMVTVNSTSDVWTALGLGPMVVAPDRQGRGIGTALVRAGLDECRKTGAEVVVVLGRPDYYPRFGFKPAKPLGVTWEIDVSEEAFMLAELQDGALAGRRGVVRYHQAYDVV